MGSADEISFFATADVRREVRDAVESGEFASTSDVVNDALRVWQRLRLENADRLKAIRTKIRQSLDDPRPDLDDEQVDERLADLYAKAVTARSGAEA